MVEPLTSHRFPTQEQYIGQLGVRLSELAGRHGWTILRWDEEGLGPAAGICLRLPSGTVVLLQEMAHLIEQGEPGPDVWVDVGDIVARGAENIRVELVASLALGPDALRHAPPDSDQVAAVALPKAIAYTRTRRRPD